jgi:hypothetical protein
MPIKKQQGFALLSVLVIISLISALLVFQSEDDYLQRHVLSNQFKLLQQQQVAQFVVKQLKSATVLPSCQTVLHSNVWYQQTNWWKSNSCCQGRVASLSFSYLLAPIASKTKTQFWQLAIYFQQSGAVRVFILKR